MIRSVKNNMSTNSNNGINRKTPQSKSIFNVLAESESDNEEVIETPPEIVKQEIKPEVKQEVKQEHKKEVIATTFKIDDEEDGVVEINNSTHIDKWQRTNKPKKYRGNNRHEETGRNNYHDRRRPMEFVEVEEEIPVEDEKPEDGEIGTSYKFNCVWYVWVHEIESRDWSPESYKIIYEIKNVSEFWRFINNIHKLNQWKYHFFLMKAHSHPTWEHTSNRNGGSASLRIDVTHSVDIIEQIVILAFNESLTDQINDINGICFAAKGSWSVVKIWNKDKRNNIANQLPGYMKKIYPSISIKYKENTPEY